MHERPLTASANLEGQLPSANPYALAILQTIEKVRNELRQKCKRPHPGEAPLEWQIFNENKRELDVFEKEAAQLRSAIIWDAQTTFGGKLAENWWTIQPYLAPYHISLGENYRWVRTIEYLWQQLTQTAGHALEGPITTYLFVERNVSPEQTANASLEEVANWLKDSRTARRDAVGASKVTPSESPESPASSAADPPRAKRRRGRSKMDEEADFDRKIWDAWQSRQYPNYERLAGKFGITYEEVSKKLDRERKRRERDAKNNDG